MTKNMDTIKFEYRSEVDSIECALAEWLEQHKDDSKAEDVRKMIDLLDVMYMSW